MKTESFSQRWNQHDFPKLERVSPGFSEGDCSLMIQHRGERRQATGGRLSATKISYFNSCKPQREGEKKRKEKPSRRMREEVEAEKKEERRGRRKGEKEEKASRMSTREDGRKQEERMERRGEALCRPLSARRSITS